MADEANLFITDGEFALCLLVLLRKGLQLLDGFGLGDRDAELDVAFCVFMAGLANCKTLSIRGVG